MTDINKLERHKELSSGDTKANCGGKSVSV